MVKLSDMVIFRYKYIPAMMETLPGGQYTRPCFQFALVDDQTFINWTVRDCGNEYFCRIKIDDFRHDRDYAFTLCGTHVTIRGLKKGPKDENDLPCKILFTIPPHINNGTHLVQKSAELVDGFLLFKFTRLEELPNRDKRGANCCYTCGEPWASGDDHVENGKKPEEVKKTEEGE